MHRKATLGVLFLLAACGRAEPGPPAPSVATSTSSATGADAQVPVASASASASGDAPGPVLPWAEAVRLERWDEAARSIDALPEADRAKPEVRYARARVALAKGDYPLALALTEHLEAELPLIADSVALHRAEAKLHAGPYLEAAQYFVARPGHAAQMKAADAYAHAKESAKARAVADHVVAMLSSLEAAPRKRARGDEARARALRVRLAEKPGPAEAQDVRWIAVNAPDVSALPNAAGELAKLDPAHPLTAQELMTRAQVLADAGRIDEALAAIDLAAVAPGPAVKPLDRQRAKGYVLFHSKSRYLEAAKLLAECAATAGPDAPEDAFHAARALSRADKDDEAMAGYDAVAKKYPRSLWGDRAAYFVPYLRLLHGEWKEAERGFDDYVRRYPDGVEKDAPRNRALSHLMTKDYKTARRLFEQLSGEAEKREPSSAARLINMAALAALGDGDRTHAVARWTEVARTYPLSYASLVARARLTKLGEPIPPAIDPPESGAALPPLGPALPPPVDMLHRIGLDADAEDALSDREGAVTAASPDRALEALCVAYGKLGRAERRYSVSHKIPGKLLRAAPGPQSRWAWECAYPSPYEGHVHAVEASDGLPPGLVYAVMKQESGYNPDVVSHARAVGLLQLLPETAKTLAGAMSLSHEDARLTSPPYNITLGARYLKNLIDRFHGQLPLAIAAYNSGPEPIARWAARSPGMDLDVFVERIPYKETRDYAGIVMGNLARYGYLERGEAGIPKVQLDLTRSPEPDAASPATGGDAGSPFDGDGGQKP